VEPTPYLHVDLDAFYASVEQLHNPDLRGKPIAVGGGVVLAASYEARSFGVSAPMPIRRARELCPRLIVVPGEFRRYGPLSEKVFDICRDFTPLIEQISIDEAFLDVAGSVHLFGPAEKIAKEIKERVCDEIGLVVSIGVARTKFLAKIASATSKPDGLLHVPPDHELTFLHALPTRAMWGVGPKTERVLADLGIETVGDIATTERQLLQRHFGLGSGAHLYDLAWNRDPRRVATTHRARSISSQSAFGRGGRDPELRRTVLFDLADRVSRRLRKKSWAARTVGIRMRFDDMTAITRRTTLAAPIATGPALAAIAGHLVERAVVEVSDGRDISLLAISTSGFIESPHLQLEFPIDPQVADIERTGSYRERSLHELDTALDEIRERYGGEAVVRAGRRLGPRGVPEEFRSLATKD